MYAIFLKCVKNDIIYVNMVRESCECNLKPKVDEIIK